MSEFWMGVIFGAGFVVALSTLVLAWCCWRAERVEVDEDLPWGSL